MVEQINMALREAGARIVNGIVNFLPNALVFIVLVAGAFVLAVAVRHLLRRGLERLQFDRRAELMGVSPAAWAPSQSASVLIASAVYWTILLLGVLVGLTALDASLPEQFAVTIFQYLPHLIAALVILVVGTVVARFLARAVLIGAVNMGVQYARLLSLTVKWLLLVVTAAMALEHLGIGRTVLLLAFGILFGGVVLTMAIAVGLGSRDAVRRALEQQVRQTEKEDTLDHV